MHPMKSSMQARQCNTCHFNLDPHVQPLYAQTRLNCLCRDMEAHPWMCVHLQAQCNRMTHWLAGEWPIDWVSTSVVGRGHLTCFTLPMHTLHTHAHTHSMLTMITIRSRSHCTHTHTHMYGAIHTTHGTQRSSQHRERLPHSFLRTPCV